MESCWDSTPAAGLGASWLFAYPISNNRLTIETSRGEGMRGAHRALRCGPFHARFDSLPLSRFHNFPPMNSSLRSSLFLLTAVLFASPSLAAAPTAGFDPARLKEIPARMQKFVDDSTVAGAVTLVARHGQVASVEAVGYADLA